MRELISEINRELTFGTSPNLTRQDLAGLSDAEIVALLPKHGLGELPGLESEWARRCWHKQHAKGGNGQAGLADFTHDQLGEMADRFAQKQTGTGP